MADCPLCSSAQTVHHAVARDIEYCTTQREYAFRACNRCGVLFIDPMETDRLGEIYPANYYSYAGGKKGLASRVKEMLDRKGLARIARSIPGDALSVLDIGGGSGWMLDMAKGADARISRTCVVDLDPAAGVLAESAGHEFVQGRIEDAPVTGKFDLVLMYNLIEHVADPRAVLLKVASLLKPQGRILIKTPNFDALDARLFRNRSWAGFHTPRHFVLFRRESLESLCRECGLEPVGFSYTQGAPFWSVSLLEELRRLGLVRITAERPAIYHPLMPLLQIGAAAFDFLRKPIARLSQMELVLKPQLP